jgi:hypothetical protein
MIHIQNIFDQKPRSRKRRDEEGDRPIHRPVCPLLWVSLAQGRDGEPQ